MFQLALLLLWIGAEAFLSVSVLNLITMYIICTADDNSFHEMTSIASSFTSYITSPIQTLVQHIARIPQMLFINLTLSTLPIGSALAVTVERMNYSPPLVSEKRPP